MKHLALLLGPAGYPLASLRCDIQSLLHEVECLLANHALFNTDLRNDYGGKFTARSHQIPPVKHMHQILVVVRTSPV